MSDNLYGAGTYLDTSDKLIPLTGFKKKTYNEILNDMISRAQDKFGGQVDLTPTSPLYLIIQNMAYEISTLWDTTEGIYYSTYVDTAEGSELDKIGHSIGLPRYRPTKSYGKVEFTRLRDPITGVYYRCDPISGSILPIPQYVHYYHPPPDFPPGPNDPPETVALYKAALAYDDYFKSPFPQVIVPEELTLSLVDNTTITYNVDDAAIIPADGDKFITLLPIECNLWGPSGNMSAYYKRSVRFNGALSKIVSVATNYYQKYISDVFQIDDLGGCRVGYTTCGIRMLRSESYSSSECIVCNCWHWYDPDKNLPNGNPLYNMIPSNLFTYADLKNAITQLPEGIPPATAYLNLLKEWMRSNPIPVDGVNSSEYMNNPSSIANIRLAWRDPDNFTIYNMDIRNMTVDDSSTWFIPDPYLEGDSLYLYFRPVLDRSKSKVMGSLDHLIFRSLQNLTFVPGQTSLSFITLYAGFGEPPADFFSTLPSNKIEGYVGDNHRSRFVDSSGNRPPFLPAENSDGTVIRYCQPRLKVNNGGKLNIGYTLQIENIVGGRDYEGDQEYRTRIKTTSYDTTATNKSIERYVKGVNGVINGTVYDSLLDPSNVNSLGFKVRVKTEDTAYIDTDDANNSETGKLINEIVKIIKPAGVHYMFDNGIGYGISFTIEVVGANYPDAEIHVSIISALKDYIKSIAVCRPLDYGVVVELFSSCIPGSVKLNRLQIRNGSIIQSNGTTVPPVIVDHIGIPSDGKYWLSNPFSINQFGNKYYLPTNGYAYLDEINTSIVIVNEKVNYYGCRRNDNCN